MISGGGGGPTWKVYKTFQVYAPPPAAPQTPMTDLAETLRARVAAIMPDLAIAQFELNQDGLINDVAIVNGQLVFRFAKNKQSATFLAVELDILDLVRPYVNLNIPTPIYRSEDAVVYPMLPGVPFTRAIMLSQDSAARAALATRLGAFLAGLHILSTAHATLAIPPSPAPVTRAQWQQIYDRVRDKVYPLLLKHQIAWAEQLFGQALADTTFFTYPPALIHGDLAPYHILFDEQSQQISGVIDFGVAGIGDPALDLGSLITTYGESFVALMAPSYPNLPAILPRARFYAQAIELQWVLLGIETGETFWFTAHLGGARDVL